jgi:hypothetical protein
MVLKAWFLIQCFMSGGFKIAKLGDLQWLNLDLSNGTRALYMLQEKYWENAIKGSFCHFPKDAQFC